MEEITLSICVDFDCERVQPNGEDNRVHLLVNFPPKGAVAKPVNSLKGSPVVRGCAKTCSNSH
ncbi:transposase [Streptomyces sp. NPDC006393]|uniref:transposase n=1 Tax=Streptomyces sp. NPDC006393 TaxID=3156763 RepID=UPI003401AA85